MELGDIFVAGIAALLFLASIGVMVAQQQAGEAVKAEWLKFVPTPPSTPTPTPSPPATPTPAPPPIIRITPIRATPTPRPTPRPTIGPRWCNETGCYNGYPPTPTPTPRATPTPSPTPAPAASPTPAPCGLPDEVKNEVWAIKQYKEGCTCEIRQKYALGPYFNLWEGCNSITSSAWRQESCVCMNLVCAHSSGLC